MPNETPPHPKRYFHIAEAHQHKNGVCYYCRTGTVRCWRCEEPPVPFPILRFARRVVHIAECPVHGELAEPCPNNTLGAVVPTITPSYLRQKLIRAASIALLVGVVIGILGGLVLAPVLFFHAASTQSEQVP